MFKKAYLFGQVFFLFKSKRWAVWESLIFQTRGAFVKAVLLLERCACFVKQTAVDFVKGVWLLENGGAGTKCTFRKEYRLPDKSWFYEQGWTADGKFLS